MNVPGCIDGGYYFEKPLYFLFLKRVFPRPADGVQRLKVSVDEVELHYYRLVQPEQHVKLVRVLLHIDVDTYDLGYYFISREAMKKASPADIAK